MSPARDAASTPWLESSALSEIPTPHFSLHHTLMSGQAFRWRRHNDGFVGVIGRTMVKLRQEGDLVQFRASDPSVTAKTLRDYLGLNEDLPAILRSIDVDTQIHAAIQHCRGLRVLRQDAWETLASFICSAYNNIKRIEGIIDRLTQTFGDPIDADGRRVFGFPHPEVLATVSERRLRSLGLGYRAAYLSSVARCVAEGKLPLDHLRRVDYDTAKSALLKCAGVGDKVADCVALFGLHKYEAFPIDVWMERVLLYYFRHSRLTRMRAHIYARRHFGPYAGYAQQYLFHHARWKARSFAAPSESQKKKAFVFPSRIIAETILFSLGKN